MDTNDDGKTVIIFRPYMTLPDGKRIWAKWYGKKAFKIELPPNATTT